MVGPVSGDMNLSSSGAGGRDPLLQAQSDMSNTLQQVNQLLGQHMWDQPGATGQESDYLNTFHGALSDHLLTDLKAILAAHQNSLNPEQTQVINALIRVTGFVGSTLLNPNYPPPGVNSIFGWSKEGAPNNGLVLTSLIRVIAEGCQTFSQNPIPSQVMIPWYPNDALSTMAGTPSDQDDGCSPLFCVSNNFDQPFVPDTELEHGMDNIGVLVFRELNKNLESMDPASPTAPDAVAFYDKAVGHYSGLDTGSGVQYSLGELASQMMTVRNTLQDNGLDPTKQMTWDRISDPTVREKFTGNTPTRDIVEKLGTLARYIGQIGV